MVGDEIRDYPAIETVETHILGGAIIPLWQRLKTDREASLRVVRVSTDEGQRIVGIHIPNDRVWGVLRSLGISRRLQDPAQIYNAVLNEGEEITLAGVLKLKKGSIHGEAAVELHCTDPYKFASLRELGLINEQIKWKQHFFIPADEEKAVEILTALFKLYPVTVKEEEAEAQECAEVETLPETGAATVIDLAEWVIPAGDLDEIDEPEGGQVEAQSQSPEATGIQPTLLQEQDTDIGTDSRKVKEQRSLFSEPLFANEPVSQPSGKKPQSWTFQKQLAFDFTDSEPPPNNSQGAASIAA